MTNTPQGGTKKNNTGRDLGAIKGKLKEIQISAVKVGVKKASAIPLIFTLYDKSVLRENYEIFSGTRIFNHSIARNELWRGKT